MRGALVIQALMVATWFVVLVGLIIRAWMYGAALIGALDD